MEIVRCAPVSASLVPLMELDERLARGDPEAIVQPRSVRMAPLLATHAFRRFGEVITLALRRRDRIAGRITIAIDRRLRGEIGWFGGLAAEDDPEVVRGLLSVAADELHGRGIRRMLGPVDLTIWHACRVQLSGPRSPRLSVEPPHPPYLAEHLLGAGLEPVRRFVTHRFPRFSVDTDRVAAAEGVATDAGYRVRDLDPARMALEMDAIHHLANAAFVDSLGFVPLSRAEFVHLFRPLARLVDPSMVILVEDPSGEPCAFLLTLPDPTPALRALARPLGWLRAPLALERSRGFVFKTLAVHPDHRGAGLAKAMAARANRAGARWLEARGGGWMLQGFFDEFNLASIHASRAALVADEPEVRRYAILGRTL